MLKCDSHVHTYVNMCSCTCAGAACVHCIPQRYVDVKVQVRNLADLRNRAHTFETVSLSEGKLEKQRCCEQSTHYAFDH